MHSTERRETHVAGGLGLLDRELQGGGAGVVVPGLALGSAQAGDLVGLGLLEPELSRPVGRAAEVMDGVVEPVLEPGQLAEHRLAADVQPGVLDLFQPALHPVGGVDGALLVTGRDRRSGGEQPVRGLVPRPVQRVVDGPAAIGELHRGAELAVMGDDVGEVVAAAGLQVGVVGRLGQLGRCGDVVAGEVEVAGRRLDPRREQEGVGSVPGRPGVAGQPPARSGSVARPCCRRGRPRPSRTRSRCAAPASGRARRPRPVPRRCWRARSGRRRGARLGGHCAHPRWRSRRPRRTRRRAPRGRARRARRRSWPRARTPGCCPAAGTAPDGHRPDPAAASPVTSPGRRPSPATGSRAGRPRRSPRLPARRALRGRTPPPAGAPRPRTWPAPRGRAGRRGTAGRSSTRWSTSATGGVPACGWSGRPGPGTGRRGAG